MSWNRLRSAALWATLFPAAATAHAQSLFGITAAGSNGATVSAGGSNVISLVNNLTSSQDQFQSLGNGGFNATLNYGGIPRAVTLDQTFDSAGNKVITLKVPSIGVTQTFSSANGSISQQVRNFLKTQGLADLGAFQSEVNRTSPIGSVDGNPMSLTALLTDTGYFQFAQQRGEAEANGGKFTFADGRGESYYWADGGAVDAGGISGTFVDLNLATEFQLTDNLGLTLTSPGRWLAFRGSNVFMGGFLLGLPISIIRGHDDGYGNNDGLSWRLTPAGHVGAVGSADFASGGLLYGGQLSSSLNYSLGGLTFTLADTAGYYHGADIEIADYHFNTYLDQWVFKNGVVVTRSWRGLVLDAGAAWTNFLQATYVDGYFTPEAGVSLRFGRRQNSGLRVGYEGNFGRGYSTNGGNVTLYVTN